jgi:ActR/RegA family two-component response regulator
MSRPTPSAVVAAHAVAEGLRAAGVDLRIKPLIAERVEHVLGLVDGNLSVAARMLGINRRSLQRRQARERRKKARR